MAEKSGLDKQTEQRLAAITSDHEGYTAEQKKEAAGMGLDLSVPADVETFNNIQYSKHMGVVTLQPEGHVRVAAKPVETTAVIKTGLSKNTK